MDEYAIEDDGAERLECPTCGRKFKEEALMKHEKVCKKVFVQKRKVFDTKKQRQVEDETTQNNDYGYSNPKKN